MLPEPGVHPVVDLRADPVDQALSDRIVIVAAEFVVRRVIVMDLIDNFGAEPTTSRSAEPVASAAAALNPAVR